MGPDGMPYADFLNAVIDDGIEEVRQAYPDAGQALKRDGAIRGFEECRGKDPDALLGLREAADRDALGRQADGAADYWFWRYRALQVEWTLNVVNAARHAAGLPVNAAPTHRGMAKAVDILGIAPA